MGLQWRMPLQWKCPNCRNLNDIWWRFEIEIATPVGEDAFNAWKFDEMFCPTPKDHSETHCYCEPNTDILCLHQVQNNLSKSFEITDGCAQNLLAFYLYNWWWWLVAISHPLLSILSSRSTKVHRSTPKGSAGQWAVDIMQLVAWLGKNRGLVCFVVEGPRRRPWPGISRTFAALVLQIVASFMLNAQSHQSWG